MEHQVSPLLLVLADSWTSTKGRRQSADGVPPAPDGILHARRGCSYPPARSSRGGCIDARGHPESKVRTETVGGEVYQYYPTGEYIVRADGVCGGRPTFKYKRIELTGTMERLAAGESIEAKPRTSKPRVIPQLAHRFATGERPSAF